MAKFISPYNPVTRCEGKSAVKVKHDKQLLLARRSSQVFFYFEPCRCHTPGLWLRRTLVPTLRYSTEIRGVLEGNRLFIFALNCKILFTESLKLVSIARETVQ